jgi:4,5:9,10-diseco-3-hydroxy-5,9,17-trioxoandrosta-1(10),2-diene-4-oate hydrolase
MTQLVFIHGPGAGGCADGFRHQLDAFPGSLAPTLPGHLSGEPCASVERYTDWLRGWLWAQQCSRTLVLVGFTLGACIALQYGLDYPEEVQGLVLMTVSMRPKQRPPGTLDFRLQAAQDPETRENWLQAMREVMQWIDPDLREHLIGCHRRVGPLSQHHDLSVIDRFDVRDRIATLKPPLLLIRGLDDPMAPPDYEGEIHQAVQGSRYITLRQAGHFPMAEQPEAVDHEIQSFISTLH